MRTRFPASRPVPKFPVAPQPRHAPLVPALQEVAQRKRMKLMEDLTSREWSSPQCVLSWTTAGGVACTCYLVGGPGDFRVDLLCWSNGRIVARKEWTSYALNATDEVRRLLEAIHEWCETLD